MYLEGYEEEGLIEVSDTPVESTVKSQEVHHSGGTTITEQEHEATFSMQPGEMSAFGLAETTLG